MEDNKYICPRCGAIMTATYEKPALNLSCPKCDCKIATTKWEEIDLDDTNYEIVLKATKNPDIDVIRVISKITGLNYIKAKLLATNGGTLLKAKAIDIKTYQEALEEADIQFEINPSFPY